MTYDPDKMHPVKVRELKRLQDKFLDGITEDPMTTLHIEALHENWVRSCFKKRKEGLNGAVNQKSQ